MSILPGPKVSFASTREMGLSPEAGVLIALRHLDRREVLY